MQTMTYDRACAAAATAQGLDPLVEALTAAGIPHTVEQAGGYCMVVVVPVPDDRVVTSIADCPEPAPFMAQTQTLAEWREGWETEPAYRENLTADQVVAYVRELQAAG